MSEGSPASKFDGFDALVKALKRDEGTKRNARGRHILYKCPADKWTIGYGRNLEENGLREIEVEFMLHNDLVEAQQEAASLFPSWLTLDVVRRNAITNMALNLGRTRLGKFHDFIAAVEARNWPAAKAALIDSKWHHDIGDRALRIEDEILTGTVATS